MQPGEGEEQEEGEAGGEAGGRDTRSVSAPARRSHSGMKSWDRGRCAQLAETELTRASQTPSGRSPDQAAANVFATVPERPLPTWVSRGSGSGFSAPAGAQQGGDAATRSGCAGPGTNVKKQRPRRPVTAAAAPPAPRRCLFCHIRSGLCAVGGITAAKRQC